MNSIINYVTEICAMIYYYTLLHVCTSKVTEAETTHQKLSERMAQGKKELKFDRNPCIGYKDNCDTDDGRISISWALLTESNKAKNAMTNIVHAVYHMLTNSYRYFVRKCVKMQVVS